MRHILIVDDEPKVAFFLGRSLELGNCGCRVDTAGSGEEALEILERDPVDLLVTDLRMPGLSGLDLIRWAKTASPGTRTILITAYGSGQVKAEAQRLSVFHCLTKPFDVREFARVVEAALNGEESVFHADSGAPESASREDFGLSLAAELRAAFGDIDSGTG